ncbi:MAG: hypothetical protein RIR62_1551 [Pseudomonadota bacterium]
MLRQGECLSDVRLGGRGLPPHASLSPGGRGGHAVAWGVFVWRWAGWLRAVPSPCPLPHGERGAMRRRGACLSDVVLGGRGRSPHPSLSPGVRGGPCGGGGRVCPTLFWVGGGGPLTLPFPPRGEGGHVAVWGRLSGVRGAMLAPSPSPHPSGEREQPSRFSWDRGHPRTPLSPWGRGQGEGGSADLPDRSRGRPLTRCPSASHPRNPLSPRGEGRVRGQNPPSRQVRWPPAGPLSHRAPLAQYPLPLGERGG